MLRFSSKRPTIAEFDEEKKSFLFFSVDRGWQEQAREDHAQEKSARYANKALEAAEKVLCKAFVADPHRATLCGACRRHAMDHFAYETPKKLAREQIKRREAADLPPLHFTAEAELLKRIAAIEAKIDAAAKVSAS